MVINTRAVQSRTLISNTRQVIEEEVVKYEVKQPGDESESSSSEESKSDSSRSGSESGYSSDSESEVDLKPKKKNVIEDDAKSASYDVATDAAPKDQEMTDVKVDNKADDTVVEKQAGQDVRSDEPEQKEETAAGLPAPETSALVANDDEDVSVV